MRYVLILMFAVSLSGGCKKEDAAESTLPSAKSNANAPDASKTTDIPPQPQASNGAPPPPRPPGQRP